MTFVKIYREKFSFHELGSLFPTKMQLSWKMYGLTITKTFILELSYKIKIFIFNDNRHICYPCFGLLDRETPDRLLSPVEYQCKNSQTSLVPSRISWSSFSLEGLYL